MNPNLSRQRGAVAIMVAVSMLVLLAVVGLCVDAGLAYLVKARLNAAVDSAALAGARAVTTGNNQTEQIASARAAAADFFAANIPNDYLLSSPRITSTNVTFNGGQATIDVKAEAPMPVSIMQIMNFTSLMPVAAAQTVRNDLDMALVVDTSGSIGAAGPGVRTAAKSFLSKFNVTQDRVALIHFASGAVVDAPISPSARGFNRSAMNTKITNFSFEDGTASVEGMWNARDQLNKVPQGSRSTMRVIVFFSDGAPTALGSYLIFDNKEKDCIEPGTLDSGSPTYALGDLNSASFNYVSDKCRLVRNNAYAARRLPNFYNAHAPDWKTATDVNFTSEFPIVTKGPREVTADLSGNYARNVDRAARNLAESVAAKAREEGIYVFTLGLGAGLKSTSAYDTAHTGEMVLKCMANTVDAPLRCQTPNQPVGMYCYAATDNDLTPCFSRLASAILRITK
jgi:Flp pilus assembly protein TadG